MWTEADACLPVNQYGKSKLEAERVIQVRVAAAIAGGQVRSFRQVRIHPGSTLLCHLACACV
jgi:hypothetical protein